MAKGKSEDYLDNLLGEVSEYTSDEDFLNEVDDDFPELEDEEFMEKFAAEIDNAFSDGFMDSKSTAKQPETQKEPEVSTSTPASEPAPAQETDSTPTDDFEFDELASILSDSEATEEAPAEPVANDEAGSTEDINLDDLGLGESLDLDALAADMPDLDGMGDVSLDGATDDLSLGDLDGLDLDALGGDSATADASEPDISSELSSLFDEVEEFEETNLGDASEVENLVTGNDSDLDDLNSMLSSEDGEGLGIDIFEGLEGLDGGFNIEGDAEGAADDLLNELTEEAEKEEKKNEKPKGIKGFFAAVLESAHANDEPELTKEEKAALKEEKKKAKEEKKAEKAAKKAEKEAKKPKKEKKKKEKPAEPKVKSKPLPKLKTLLIFLLAASIIVLFIFGTKFFGYKLTISRAKGHFNSGNYVEAYNDIKGVKLKENEEFLKKEITLMNKLYKHFSSYENLYYIKMYPEALVELLDAVKVYDEGTDEAYELGISEIYANVLDKVSSKLMTNYGIGLKRAREINDMYDSIEFSKAVYEITDALYKTTDKDE